MPTYTVEVPGFGPVKTLTPMTPEEVIAQYQFVSKAAEIAEAVTEADEIAFR